MALLRPSNVTKRFGEGDWVLWREQVYRISYYFATAIPLIVFIEASDGVVRVTRESECEPLDPALVKLMDY